jgi:predicted lipoprotein with Yx(FWY)xxD motif
MMSDCLTTNQWLANDTQLVSANGQYAAYLQSDANLVLCHAVDGGADLGRPYWSAFANASGLVCGPHQGAPYYAIMQDDGNFVLYNGKNPENSGPPFWASHTNQSKGQFTAIMQDDGNFVVYKGTPAALGSPVWASDTWWAPLQVAGGNTMTTLQWMANGDSLVSYDGVFSACLQDDGDLALFEYGRQYWSAFNNAANLLSGQRHGPPFFAIVHSNGNFALYNGDPGKRSGPYWATGPTRASGQFSLVMYQTGNLVLYDETPGVTDLEKGRSNPIWASNTPIAASHVGGPGYKTGKPGV